MAHKRYSGREISYNCLFKRNKGWTIDYGNFHNQLSALNT